MLSVVPPTLLPLKRSPPRDSQQSVASARLPPHGWHFSSQTPGRCGASTVPPPQRYSFPPPGHANLQFGPHAGLWAGRASPPLPRHSFYMSPHAPAPPPRGRAPAPPSRGFHAPHGYTSRAPAPPAWISHSAWLRQSPLLLLVIPLYKISEPLLLVIRIFINVPK